MNGICDVEWNLGLIDEAEQWAACYFCAGGCHPHEVPEKRFRPSRADHRWCDCPRRKSEGVREVSKQSFATLLEELRREREEIEEARALTPNP
eukprot:6173297-Pleurochrysis_carterae.AAC.2